MVPLKQSVQLRKRTIAAKDALKWQWSAGAATSVDDFHDPVTSAASYRLCVYDSSARTQPLLGSAIIAGGPCGTRACWKATKAGFAMSNKGALPDGITKVKLVAGPSGRAKILVAGKGESLKMPALLLIPPVTVQLIAQDGHSLSCWQTTYTIATDSDAFVFKARGP